MPIRRTRAVPAAGIPDHVQTKGSPEFVVFHELRETAFTRQANRLYRARASKRAPPGESQKNPMFSRLRPEGTPWRREWPHRDERGAWLPSS